MSPAAPISRRTLPVILALSALACSLVTPAATPSASTSTTRAREAASPTARPTSEPTSTGVPRVPERDLDPTGPWWTFSTSDGLYAVNADGSGLTPIHDTGSSTGQISQISSSAAGTHLAYVTSDGVFDPTLYVHALPQVEPIAVIPLTSPDSAPGPDAMPGDTSLEAARAITEVSSLAFAPDGRSLAFMGAIDGPTSDLYLLTLQDLETARLTDGPSHGYRPIWSPDGEHIIHAGVRTFGTGAGYSLEGVWAARADGSGVIMLYSPSSGDEEIVGWVDDQTFVAHSWNVDCERNNLRTVNIASGLMEEMWPGPFGPIAFNPLHAVAVVGVDEGICDPGVPVGLYHIPTDGNAPLRVVGDRVRRLAWSPGAELILAETEFGVLAVDSHGQFIDLDVPASARTLPAAAAGSKALAWAGESLWIGPLLGSIENPPQEIFTGPVSLVTWAPGGQSVLFISEGRLYSAHGPDFIVLLAAQGLTNLTGFESWLVP